MQALALSILMLAQASQAGVVGTVRDATTGRAVPDASVLVSEIGLRAETDASGRYALHRVPAGPRHVEVRAAGYEPLLVHALVPVQGTLEIHAELVPAPVEMSPLVVRSPDGPPGRPGNGPARNLASDLHRHPGLAEPDILSAAAATAAAHAAIEAPAGLSVAGATPDQTAYTVDGLPVFNPVHAMGVHGAWNPDAMARATLTPGPTALSAGGLLAVETRRPGSELRSEGSVGTRQARILVDGPVGSAGAGYLLSLRRATTGLLSPADEPSYLRGGMQDWLAKVEVPLLEGTLTLLTTGASDRATAATGSTEGSAADAHDFEWEGGVTGFRWLRTWAGGAVDVRGWSSGAEAEADWRAPAGDVRMRNTRRESGVAVEAELASLGGRSRVGLSVDAPRTRYETEAPTDAPGLDLRSEGVRTRIDVGHGRRLTRDLTVDAGASLVLPRGHVTGRFAVGLELTPALAIGLEASHGVQDVQSLRNVESVVGAVFPAELFVGVGATGVPAVKASHLRVGVLFDPAPGLRLEAAAHVRRLRDVTLVSPVEGAPFAIGAFGVGSTDARGLSVDAEYGAGRVAFQAGYAWLAVRRHFAGRTFVPGYVPDHELRAAIAVYPSPTWALRVAGTSAFGRRGLPVGEDFEWETCNLLDRGCEFAGSPDYGTAIPGTTRLPTYLRLDLGVRKHWHVRVGSERVTLEAFATLVNVFGRSNVLTFARESDGSLFGVDMVPASPLVVGLDWRF